MMLSDVVADVFGCHRGDVPSGAAFADLPHFLLHHPLTVCCYDHTPSRIFHPSRTRTPNSWPTSLNLWNCNDEVHLQFEVVITEILTELNSALAHCERNVYTIHHSHAGKVDLGLLERHS